MKKNVLFLSLATLFIMTICATASYARHPRPQLGAYLGELSDELRNRLGFQDQGVLIHDVVKGSGAEKAGLKQDDIIIEFNRQKVTSVQDLVSEVRKTAPGEKVNLSFFRKGETRTLLVEITEKKDWIGAPAPHKWVYFRGDRPSLGLRTQQLTPQLAEYFKAQSGILITDVTEDGPAHKADLRAGDVIIAWQGNEVRDSREFYRQLSSSAAGDRIALRVIRHGQDLEKEIVLGEPKRQESYGFHINRDDTGDLVFRMGNKKYPGHIDIPLPDLDLDLKGLKDCVNSLQDGLRSYHEEMKKLRNEILELRQEIKSLPEKDD